MLSSPLLFLLSLTAKSHADANGLRGIDARSQPSVHWAKVEPRIQSDVDWTYALCRGEQLLQKIKAQRPGSPRFNSFDDFQQYGYRTRVGPVYDDNDGMAEKLSSTVLTLQTMPTLVSVCQRAKHGRALLPCRWYVSPKLGHFTACVSSGCTTDDTQKRNIVRGGSVNSFTYLATHGALSCDATKTPAEPQPDVLSRLSDIMFLAWQHACEEAATDVGSLAYVFRSHVTNDDTLAIASKALQGVDLQAARPWPGIDFDMGTEAGKALLGSPNGVAVAWMLIDRQTTFPGKTVSKVTVYVDDVGDTSLLFHIGDLQPRTG